jgi:hypothetical protein
MKFRNHTHLGEVT